MFKKFFFMIFVMSCLFVVADTARAQGGGKAEPNRIQFKRGAHSATVKGRVKGDEQAEYTFGASQGQSVSIRIAAVPTNAVTIELQTPAGESFELKYVGTGWIGTIPETGDYFMVVKIPSGGSTTRARYTLTISIK